MSRENLTAANDNSSLGGIASAAGGTGGGGGAQAPPVAAGILANAAQGRLGEAMTSATLGDSVAGSQISFITSTGARTRADFLTNDLGIVETKTGGATLTVGQQQLRADILAGVPVTPVGQNAANAGLAPGQPILLNSYQVDRPF